MTTTPQWSTAMRFAGAGLAAQSRISAAQTLTEAMLNASEAITLFDLARLAGRAAQDAEMVTGTIASVEWMHEERESARQAAR